MFEDRTDAGKKLANKLQSYKKNNNTIVIGLPRGGVVVAFQVAQKLNLPLDIVAPRKISLPDNPEAAIGAITPDGHKVFDDSFIADWGIKQEYLDKKVAKEIAEAKRRIKLYRENKKPLKLKDKIVIIVDDGIATGSTMSVTIQSIRSQNPKKIIIAIPVAPGEFLQKIASRVNEIICLETPSDFGAVGQVYKNFTQTTDDEVVDLMRKAQ